MELTEFVSARLGPHRAAMAQVPGDLPRCARCGLYRSHHSRAWWLRRPVWLAARRVLAWTGEA